MTKIENGVIDLNSLDSDGAIVWPYCNTGKQYSYGASGLASHDCDCCHRRGFWDFTHKLDYKARVRKFTI